jgi:hypothetical protein
MRPVKCLDLCLVLVLFAPAARAQQEVEEAKRYFEAGRQAYESGQYIPAVIAFEESYKRAPRSAIVFSLAQSYRQQYSVDRDARKLKRAVELYRQYLSEVPQGGRREDAAEYVSTLEPQLLRMEEKGRIEAMQPMASETQIMVTSRARGSRATASIDSGKPKEVPAIETVSPGKHAIRVEAPGFFPEETEGLAVEGRLVVVEVALKEKPARLALKGPSGAEVTIDGRQMASLPLARPLEVTGGRHFVAVTKRGHHAWSREVSLARGEELALDAPLETTTQRVVAWVVLGGGAASLVTAGAFSLLALQAEGDAEDILGRRDLMNISEEDRLQYEDARAERDRWSTRSYVAYGIAGGLAAAGLLLYFVDTPRAEAPAASSSPAITPGVGDGSFGVSLGLPF